MTTVLVINVEIWPGGYEFGKRTLAKAHIGNINDLADTSDYVVAASEATNPFAGTPSWTARGRIDGHDRRQSVWAVVEKAAAWAASEALKSQ